MVGLAKYTTWYWEGSRLVTHERDVWRFATREVALMDGRVVDPDRVEMTR
jgi:hypothetical protein